MIISFYCIHCSHSKRQQISCNWWRI